MGVAQGIECEPRDGIHASDARRRREEDSIGVVVTPPRSGGPGALLCTAIVGTQAFIGLVCARGTVDLQAVVHGHVERTVWRRSRFAAWI